MNEITTPPFSASSSQASSRAQSPLPVMMTPRNSFLYFARRFIQKIPPLIRYGLPGMAIGAVIPRLYNYTRSKMIAPMNNSSTTQVSQPKSDSIKEVPVSTGSTPSKQTKPPVSKQTHTPIPKPTYDPKHPRTGYRYTLPFD